MAVWSYVDALPDTIYTYVDQDSHPRMCEEFDRMIAELREILKRSQHTVLVDGEGKTVRRLDRMTGIGDQEGNRPGPCPGCGSMDMIRGCERTPRGTEFYVGCRQCGYTETGPDPKGVIDKWNQTGGIRMMTIAAFILGWGIGGMMDRILMICERRARNRMPQRCEVAGCDRTYTWILPDHRFCEQCYAAYKTGRASKDDGNSKGMAHEPGFSPDGRRYRWARRSTHTGWCPSDAATWATAVSTSSA